MSKKITDSVFENCGKLNLQIYPYLAYGDDVIAGNALYMVMNPQINGTGTVEMVGYMDSERIVIPAYITVDKVKYRVTKVLDGLFKGNKTMKTLVIGANLVNIADQDFAGCTNLESVTGGAGIKTIGARAFENCPKLKTFNIISKNLSKIGAYAFASDTSLKTLQIKKTTTLTKAGVKGSLCGSAVKTVKVKKKKIKKYKKFFKKSNCGKKVKVKK